MELLILAVVVLIVCGILCWIVQSAPILNPTIKWAIQALIVVVGLLVIVQRSGLL